jgi:hypothetical protein
MQLSGMWIRGVTLAEPYKAEGDTVERVADDKATAERKPKLEPQEVTPSSTELPTAILTL